MENKNSLSKESILDKFLSQEGRLNRWKYFNRFLVLCLAGSVLDITLAFLLLGEGELINKSVSLACAMVGLILLYPNYCLILRRVKDMDKPLWLAKACVAISGICIIAFNYDAALSKSFLGMGLGLISGIFGLYILFVRGTKGENKYGPDPLS